MHFACRVLDEVSKNWGKLGAQVTHDPVEFCAHMELWKPFFFPAASHLNEKSLPCAILQAFLCPNKEKFEAKF